MKKIITLLVFSFWGFVASSQINPPTLVCVYNLNNGDVQLEWDLPVNTCSGAFNGYRIWLSSDTTQPFNLLALVTNPAQTTFTHTNANGGNLTWYYYLTTDINCFNQVPVKSETLANVAPIVPQFQSVSVLNNGDVQINWERSPSVDAYIYVVFWETPNGFVPIDTVVGRSNTSYVHAGVDASAGSQNYTIVALDRCGNAGLINDKPHRTIHLNATTERCDRTVSLSWNAYENWEFGTGSHQIWLSTNGGAEQFIDVISGSATNYTYYDAEDGDQLCFRVYAVRTGTSIRSSSNIVCMNIDNVKPMDDIYIRNLSVNPDNQVEVTWSWTPDADIESYDVERADSSDAFQFSINQGAVFPLDATNTYTDSTANVNGQTYTYRVHTTDSCNSLVFSNTAKTIHLQGLPLDNFTNTIEWTQFEIEFGRVMSYNIYRVVNGVETLLDNVNILTRKYVDPVNGYDEAEANVCYYIEAVAEMEYPDGTLETIYSRSNTFCIQQFALARAPNAFAPYGENTIFKPILVFSENADYYMVVFDRWGSQLFETNDPEIGWDGRKNGEVMRQGVYAYLIRLTQPDGKVVEQSGSVLLLR